MPKAKKREKKYLFLAPNMAPIHFNMIINLMGDYGYQVELLEGSGTEIINEGLRYVHNDTCYPALLVIGQIMRALHSGKYDLENTAIIMTQTGGGCRASNYIHLIRKALEKDGLVDIPVISLNLSGLEKNTGFRLSVPMLRKALALLVYGDLLMLLNNQVKPYEREKGAAAALVKHWTEKINELQAAGKGFSSRAQKRYCREIAQDFAAVPRDLTPKVKVGIVGEIYVKYSAAGNNHLEDFLFEQGCEVNVPGILGFIFYCVDQRIDDIDLYGGSNLTKWVIRKIMKYLTSLENNMLSAVRETGVFHVPASFYETKSLCKDMIGYGCKMGEGWLLTAEMNELIESGYGNIICIQPFGCLPNHIVGKGMIRALKTKYPSSNVVPIDYDPSATKVNQENRIKLMLAVAKEQITDEKK